MALLTARERDVMCLLAQGKSNKEIAATLYITPGTVRAHTTSIFSKLDVRSRTEAVLIAQECGLVQPIEAISPIAQTIALLLEMQPSALQELKQVGTITPRGDLCESSPEDL